MPGQHRSRSNRCSHLCRPSTSIEAGFYGDLDVFAWIPRLVGPGEVICVTVFSSLAFVGRSAQTVSCHDDFGTPIKRRDDWTTCLSKLLGHLKARLLAQGNNNLYRHVGRPRSGHQCFRRPFDEDSPTTKRRVEEPT